MRPSRGTCSTDRTPFRGPFAGYAIALALALPVLQPGALASQEWDLRIDGATIVDGTGARAREADIAVEGGRIVAIGELSGRATRVIDASGLHVFPGFIDTHSHATWGLVRPELAGGEALLRQGITTIVANPDGGGPSDLTSQRDTLESLGVGVNVAPMIGHGAVRRAVLGMQAREATPDELERMRALVRAGMEEGAFGLSSGLYYSPGSYAPTGEVIELARVSAEYGAPYQSHIRDESSYTVGLVEAVEEVIEIARATGAPGVVTHIKALGPPVWGASEEVVRRIEAARAEGVEVYADQYPYEASGTSIVGALVPRWALAGGDDSFAARLDDPDDRERLVAEMWENLARRGGPERLVFQGGGDELKGKSLAEVAGARGMDAIETSLALLEEGAETSVTSFNMRDDDVLRFMRQPWRMTSSDGILRAVGEGQPHPRDFGAFPRQIRKYVLDEGILSLEAAIHGMTGLPAEVYGLDDRGVIREGAIADLVIVALDEFRDVADYETPSRLSEGVAYAILAGQVAIDDFEFLDARHGQVLKRGTNR